jgi:hypothetical protein
VYIYGRVSSSRICYKNAGSKFREVAEAYETLENDKKRQEYDDYGDVNDQSFGGRNPFRGGGYDFDMRDFDMSDDIFDIFTKAMNRKDQGIGVYVCMYVCIFMYACIDVQCMHVYYLYRYVCKHVYIFIIIFM